jgi:FAD/FMN-containing dehydrogenase
MAVDEILQVVHEYGGSVSHHYGIGLKRGKHLPDALGDSGMTLARAVKTGFDRHVLSNPGKLV